ncbi:MAG: amidohydrolase [Betaproteobacteria bacterium]|nr:amidohydrolase [Betaproteobacteria bacterium]
MRIDAHHHAIPERVLHLLRHDPVYRVTIEGDLFLGGNWGNFRLVPSWVDPTAKLAHLESKGLTGAVVSAAPKPLFYYEVDEKAGEAMCRATNLGLAEFCGVHPDRLRWMAHVPMQAPERAVAMLDEAVAAGCVGVLVATSIAGRRLDEPRFEGFWGAVERLGLPVNIHPGYLEPNPSHLPYYLDSVIGNLVETTTALERLICARVFDRHPKLRVLVNHAGGFFPFAAGRLRHSRTNRPELAEAPENPWAYLPQIWFDTITHDVAALRYLVQRVGVSQVVMGTDMPFDVAPHEPMRELLEAVGPETAKVIAEDNPAALFGWKA